MAQPNPPIKQETPFSRKTASHLYKEFYRFSGNREVRKNAIAHIDYKRLSTSYHPMLINIKLNTKAL